jgi:hypothetical protein
MRRCRWRYFITRSRALLQPEQAHMQLRRKGAGGLFLLEDQAASAHAHLPMQLAALQYRLDKDAR